MPHRYATRRTLVRGRAVAGGTAYVGPGDIVTGWRAWYGLRGFSAAYAAPGTNFAVDVVNTSTGTPTTPIKILPNGSLDQAAIIALGYGVSVTKIYDQTGNGFDVAMTTLANMPVLTPNGFGSLPTIVGSNVAGQYLFSATSITQAQPWVVSSVARRTGNFTSENDLLVVIGGVTVSLGFLNATNSIFEFAGGSALSTAATDSAYHAMQFTGNGGPTSSEIYLDGVSNTGSAGTNQMGAAPVALMGTGSANPLVGNFQELGIRAGTMTPGEKSSLNSQQHTYWGF